MIFEMRFENYAVPHPDEPHLKRMGGQVFYLEDGTMMVCVPNSERLYEGPPVFKHPENVYDEWTSNQNHFKYAGYAYAFRKGEAMDVES